MAGHSKWNNIKNRKGAVDERRGKTFAQVAKVIRVAVKEGGSADPKFNPSLRTALEKARAVNMPKEKVQKAIDRGLGKSASGSILNEVLYEGYGPGGVAMLVSAVSDNVNRTASEVRFIFSRSQGSLTGSGSAKHLFTRAKDGGWVANMMMSLSEADMQSLTDLVSKLLDNDDVEEVFVATQMPVDDDV